MIMDGASLQDRIYWGLNVAARLTGTRADAYRPSSASNPLVAQNRYLRLNTTFTSIDRRIARAVGYGNALWYGIFDAAYTQPGDYLVRADGIWFVAAQQPLLPVLCVQTNRLVTFNRPAAQNATGVNAYGGITATSLTPLLEQWPASVITASTAGRPDAGLPSDTSVPYSTVLLPAFPGVTLRVADLMSDELGRTAVVAAAELTELGWRLTVKQVTT